MDPGAEIHTDAGRRRRAWIALGVAAAACILLAAVGTAAWRSCGFGTCPDVSQLSAHQPRGASLLLDRNGEPFADLLPDQPRMVSLDALPATVPQAFLAVEDQRFYGTRASTGVAWSARSWRTSARARPSRASARSPCSSRATSSPSGSPARRGRCPGSCSRCAWPRDRGTLQQGRHPRAVPEQHLLRQRRPRASRPRPATTSAARPRGSRSRQAALLAASAKGPSHYNPRRHPDRARRRRDLVLTLMERQGRVWARGRRRGARRAARGGSRQPPRGAGGGLAPYFVEEVRAQLEESFGERPVPRDRCASGRRSTSRRSARRRSELRAQLRTIETGALGKFTGPLVCAGAAAPADAGTPYLQGAVVALEVGRGDVLAWVGGRDFRQSRFDRV